MSVDNVLLAIEEKRKWERRLDSVAGELSALVDRRKAVLAELHSLRDERTRLLAELCETYELDAPTMAAKHSSGPGNMAQR